MSNLHFLRYLINTVNGDSIAEGKKSQLENTEAAQDSTEESAIFIAPLQQKIELLKKAVDVNNVYSDGVESEEVEKTVEQQLQDMLKIAGIAPTKGEQDNKE